MPKPFESTIDMLLDVGLDTLIGALVLAFMIAVVSASAYLWLRRGKSDVTALLVALIVVTNVACLVTGAGFIKWTSQSTQFRIALRRPSPLASGHERWQNSKLDAYRLHISFLDRSIGNDLPIRENGRLTIRQTIVILFKNARHFALRLVLSSLRLRISPISNG